MTAGPERAPDGDPPGPDLLDRDPLDRDPLDREPSDLELTVAVIGAGRLGRSLALGAARAGFRVLLEDVLPSNLRHAQEFLSRELMGKKKRAEGALHPLTETDRTLTPGHRSQGATRASAPEEMFSVAFVSSIEDAVRSAALVIDCVPDELESKLEILWLLDRMAPPHAVFATPTVALSIADLAACTYRPDKCVAIAADSRDLGDLDKCAGADVELRTTATTSRETLALLERFWRALGCRPVFRQQA
jgi:3-hydroxybutyryl-CoA dehydrogenase